MKLQNIFSTLQKIGQSLMVPVSVLPAAGLLVALGRVLKDLNHGESLLGNILFSGGLAIFEQLPLIFAIGVAIGFTGGAGVAGLAAAVGYFTLTNILKTVSDTEKLQMAINTGVFGGIIVGLMTASIYQRFHQIKLHPVLGFFSGKRFVPLMTAGCAFLLAIALAYVWPPIQMGIFEFGKSVIGSDWGPAFYAAGKRLLIPVGLHHVYYPPFLFQFGDFITSAGQTVHGESARYFAGDPTAGRFMASEYPLMLFGLPAAALAMYLAAPKDKRKAVGGVMLSAALTSIITGITEPIEFAFIFVAPLLYFLHVGLAFLSGVLVSQLDIHLGYTFSASIIDFVLGFFNQKNSLYLFAVVGPVIGLIYFFSFYSLIRIFNFKTPGRELETEIGNDSEGFVPKTVTTSKTEKAFHVLQALGGRKNIVALDACITRLRLTVKNPELVQIEVLKKLGAAGVMKSGVNFQAIFGVESDLLKEEIREISKRVILASPINGEVMELGQVPDATFAEKMLGDGFAVLSNDGIIRSPANGKIVNLFHTKHALGLETEDGLELLIHVGIDTVKMNGEGFVAFIKEGDQVRAGDKLLQYDRALVRNKAKSEISPIIITNMDKVKKIKISSTAQVLSGQPVLDIELNG